MEKNKIIDGKEISKKILYELKVEAEKVREKTEYKAGLAVVLVGSDPASQIYVKKKRETCEKLGFYSEAYDLAEDTKESELLALIKDLNEEPSIHGILVQLPLPKHIDENKIINAINPDKDVDVFHPINQAKVLLGDKNAPKPCTPAGVLELLKRYEVEIAGKHAVIIGRSNIVGKPLSLMLLHENATVTICHSKTKNISEIAKQADILISAVGKENMVTADMVKEGAIVIDVGTNRNKEGKLVGDIDYKNVYEVASLITPVPGGVGPMTIAMLMKNTFDAFRKIMKV
ncbi:MAG: bifunctional methylenetetrahydrofolate dehydrogenase/methenyltetrahydrofolate cyclohydrolase FolD [Candidatus Sericytochromatia bacterium]